VLAAADAYSYMHLLIVAGIIIFAGGIRIVVHDRLSPPMPEAGRLAFCGGLALYLAGVAAFRLRMVGRHSPGRLVVAVALLALGGLGGGLPAWSIAAGAAVLVVGLCATEAVSRARSGEPDEAEPAASADTTPEAPAEPAARVVDPSRGPG
jgi:low temperature requirement protein LtrA